MKVTDDPIGREDARGGPRILASTQTVVPDGVSESEHAVHLAKQQGCTCTPTVRRLTRAERRQLSHRRGEHHYVGHDAHCALYRALLARTS